MVDAQLLAVRFGFRAIVKYNSDSSDITVCYLAVLFAPCLAQYAIGQHVMLYSAANLKRDI